jgi:hypothetical protein
MAIRSITENLGAVLAERQVPTITMWNRLEGRPRTDNFDRALRAEVRDALWMLARQWQLGELHGDDAGSPVFAKVHSEATRLRRYRAGGDAGDAGEVEPFDDGLPLEAKVEARPITFTSDQAAFSLDLRLLLGRQWLKMLAPLGDFSSEFTRAYPVDPPVGVAHRAHPEVWSAFAAVAGRRMDGAKLYLHLTTVAQGHAWDGIAALDPLRDEVDEVAARFVEWFRALVQQPAADDAWAPERLEYRFACSAPAGSAREEVLVAEEYFHGHLDWYSVDRDGQAASLGKAPATEPGLPLLDTQTLLPAPVSFDGMPNTRWWAFEDGKTNFGDIRPDTTDLAKLLLIEFGLVYANDWFLVPRVLPAGSLARVRGLAVTNVFGERTWVEAAGSGADDDWQRWAMFLVNVREADADVERGDEAADTALVLLPTTMTVQEGRPLEEVRLIRDEVANMVWGIETSVPLPTGQSKPGREAARERRAFLQEELARRLAAAPAGSAPAALPLAEGAAVRYQAMSTVPEEWIPFVPVHVADDVRQVQLQRAAMPRFLDGDPDDPEKVRPRTSLLRPGLDTSPKAPYLVHEEEVPRAGAWLTQAFQRTRWRDGRTYVWLGARKRTGRGEGSSGLAFDRLLAPPAADQGP